MLSYNALPGAAIMEQMRRIMLSVTEDIEGDTAEKAKRGVAYLQRLRANKARFFTENPAAEKMLDKMLKSDVRYVVHEYLPPSMHALYFADVVREMAGAELTFAGTYPILQNYPELATTSAIGKDLAAVDGCMEIQTRLERGDTINPKPPNG